MIALVAREARMQWMDYAPDVWEIVSMWSIDGMGMYSMYLIAGPEAALPAVVQYWAAQYYHDINSDYEDAQDDIKRCIAWIDDNMAHITEEVGKRMPDISEFIRCEHPSHFTEHQVYTLYP